MTKAIWNGAVLAASEVCVTVEGNAYFPPEAVNWDCLRPSDTHSVCHWKGVASYYDVVVEGRVNADAAWVYRDPRPAASAIRDHLAFWKGVQVA